VGIGEEEASSMFLFVLLILRCLRIVCFPLALMRYRLRDSRLLSIPRENLKKDPRENLKKDANQEVLDTKGDMCSIP